MKKLFTALILLLICYIIFFDLKHGTLPTSNEEETESIVSSTEPTISYFEEKVRAGDTVLTIVENKLQTQIPVSINEIVNDFISLNNGITPEKIQIGKTYRFPNYQTN
ncbi:hypothetical protein [Neobacillus sp. D3-1R]|uniref:hypothetical protein n=1 Tax=Neobacillus sp. D3-1R TaxID=3445778 RepID=UPI003FA190BE